MRIEERLREAELAFLNAPFRPGGWMGALERLGEATACTRFQLVGFGGPLIRALNMISDPPADFHRHLHNPQVLGASNWRLGTVGRPLELSWERDYAAFRLAHDTAIYDDACSDLDGHLGCQTSLYHEGATMVGLVMVRSRREGPCDGDILERFARVSRQAQRALAVQFALGRESAGLMIDGLHGRREATFLLDRYGQVLALTEAAEGLLSGPGPLRLRGRALQVTDPRAQTAFVAALGRLLAGDGMAGPVLHVARLGPSPADQGGGWRLTATRLPQADDGLGFDAALAVTVGPLRDGAT